MTKRVYIYGVSLTSPTSPLAIKQVRLTPAIAHCGGPVVVDGLGRKPLGIPFIKVCEALQAYQDRGQAAEGCY